MMRCALSKTGQVGKQLGCRAILSRMWNRGWAGSFGVEAWQPARVHASIQLVCLIALFGCQHEPDKPDPVPVATAEGGITISPRPVSIISANDESGGIRFTRATVATRLSGGRIAIADAADMIVRIFSPAGELLHAAGRAGGGPGEFRSLSGMWQCMPDSLFVWDPALNRISVFGAAGALAREIRLTGRPAMIRCSPNGVLAVLASPDEMRMPDPTGKPSIVRSQLDLYGADGSKRASIGEIQAYDNRPAGARTRLVLSADRLLVGTQSATSVEEFEFDGSPQGSRELGLPNRPLTKEMYAAMIEDMFASIGPSPQRDSLVAYMLRIPSPPHLPPYADLFLSPGQVLWADLSIPGSGTSEFVAQGKNGKELGRIRLNMKFQAFEFGDDYLLGMAEDDDGLQRITLFGISGLSGPLARNP